MPREAAQITLYGGERQRCLGQAIHSSEHVDRCLHFQADITDAPRRISRLDISVLSVPIHWSRNGLQSAALSWMNTRVPRPRNRLQSLRLPWPRCNQETAGCGLQPSRDCRGHWHAPSNHLCPARKAQSFTAECALALIRILTPSSKRISLTSAAACSWR